MKNIIRLMLTLFVLLATQSRAGDVQSIESIQQAMESFAKANFQADGQFKIIPAQLDGRLQLPACQQPLQVFSQTGEIKPGRNTVGIRCSSERGWTIYSALSIKAFKDVLVLRKPVQRNEIITLEHLGQQSLDISSLPGGYVSDVDQVVNRQATRNLSAGSILNPQNVTAATLIKRGERISIQAIQSGMTISASGMAMADGSLGQVISVKNVSSQKVVQGTVVNAGLVTVN